MSTNEKILKNIKDQIAHLYAALPQQFALEHVKFHMRKTLESISAIESKRKKREANIASQTQSQVGIASLSDAQAAIKLLDGMLENEKKNLNNVQQQESKLLNG